MKELVKLLLASAVASLCVTAYAASSYRIPQLSNQKIETWETIIYPGKAEKLSMHNHARDRVLVALTDGVLKVTNNRGQSYILKIYKNHSYFLKADNRNEMHTDENITNNLIKVVVIELKD